MGWKDAPLADEVAPAWKSAPEVESPSLWQSWTDSPVRKSIGRGVGLGLAGLFDALGGGEIDPKTLKARLVPIAEGIRSATDEYFPRQEGLGQRAIEGAAGGIGSLPAMAAGAAGNVGADLASRFAPEGMKAPARIAGGILAGGLAGAVMPPKWSGAPIQPPDRVAADTRTLTEMALNRVGPQVATEDVANRAGAAATQTLGNTRGAISSELGRTLEGMPQIPLRDALDLQARLRGTARSEARPPQAEEYRSIADALTSNNRAIMTPGGPQMAPQTWPQDLSLTVKSFKGNSPAIAAGTGEKIASTEARNASKLAEALLEQKIPGYGAAMQRFAGRSASEVDPLTEGIIGKLAGNRPFESDPTAPGALNAIAKQSPEGITSSMQQLGSAFGPPGNLPRDIARAVLQEKLAKAPLAPGKTAYGTPGSLDDQKLGALVSAGGANPQAVRAPLAAADALAAAQKQQSGATEYLSAGPGGLSARGILKLSMLQRMAQKTEYRNQVGKLMQSASPQELEALRSLAINDPNLRALLASQGALIPTLQGAQ